MQKLRRGTVPEGYPARKSETNTSLLSAEAVRKGDVQERMWERPGSAVGFAGGL